MDVSKRFPWFLRYESLFEEKDQGFPSVLLWVAREGVGLREFLQEKAPLQVKHGADLCWIEPEASNAPIKIEQIRQLIEFIQLKSFSTGPKLAVIAEAHRMNINAQNALLKTLEELPDQAFIWLETTHPQGLLPTIQSRAQRQPIYVKKEEAFSYFEKTYPAISPKWLWDQSCFGPLRFSLEENPTETYRWLEDFFENPLSFEVLNRWNAAWAKTETSSKRDDFFDGLYRWVLDWYFYHLGGKVHCVNDAQTRALSGLAFTPNHRERLNALLLKMQKIKRAFASGVNLNQEMAIEELWIEFGIIRSRVC